MTPLLRFLRALVGEVAPGRVIYVGKRAPAAEGGDRGSWSQVPFSSLGDAEAWLEAHAGDADTYFAPAQFSRDGGRKAGVVIARSWISADIDDKVMPGSTPEERHHQAGQLARSLPFPCVIVDSGNGFHVHARLPEGQRVEEFEDPQDGVARIERLGRALRLLLEDRAREILRATVALDHTHGAERVWRVPGGVNVKVGPDSSHTTMDRSRWKLVTLVAPGRPEGLEDWPAAQLDALLPFVSAAEDEEAVGARAGKPGVATTAPKTRHFKGSAGTVVARGAPETPYFDPTALPDGLRDRWPLRDGDQSGHDFAVAVELFRAGYSPVTARAAIRVRRSLLADPADRAKGEREDYVDRTLRAAWRQAGCPPTPPPSKPYRRFPVDLLPVAVREFCVESAKAMCAAVEAVILPLLSALASAIGSARIIELKKGWPEPAILWSAVILPSGKLKSPSLDKATAPVRWRQEAALTEFQAAMELWKEEMAAHKEEMERRRKSKAADEPPKPPPKPTAKRYLVSDTTLEALVPILNENPAGVLLSRDEVGGWILSFDAYRKGAGGDLQTWLSIHRGGEILVDRKSERQILHVPHAYVSICGGIQPKMFRRLAKPEHFEAGLIARFLLCMPDAPTKRWTEAEVSERVLDRIDSVFGRLYSLRDTGGVFEDDAAPADPQCMTLTAAARRAWAAFYDDFAERQDELPLDSDLDAAFSKLEGYAARLALVIRLVRWAEGHEENPPTHVDLEDIQAGIELARWFTEEAERVYEQHALTKEAQDHQELLHWIRRRGGRARVRDVQHGGPHGLRADVAEVERALEELRTLGHGWWEQVPPPQRGGLATRVFVLRPEHVTGQGSDASTEARGANDAEGPDDEAREGGPDSDGAEGRLRGES